MVSLEDLRSSVRAVNRKLDNLRMDAALCTGVLPLNGRKIWLATEIDWDDPKIPRQLREEYFSLLEKRNQLSYESEKREAEEKNQLELFEAREIAYGWLNVLGDDGMDWLIKHHLTTVTLTDAILKNPNFLEGDCL